MMIRAYAESDRELLRAITVQCFVGVSIEHNIEQRYGSIAGKDWQWRKARHIDADIAANAAGIWVAEEGGQVVGYVTTQIDRETRIGRIPNLAVLPGHQGQGIGRKLIAAALNYLAAEGMLYARIETLAQNAVGQHLYSSMGFQEVARQIHYIMPLER